MNKMCGQWVSQAESPLVKVFRYRLGYMISFHYQLGNVITSPIKRSGDLYSIDLFGRMELDYDEFNDRLLIAGEGVFLRDYNHL